MRQRRLLGTWPSPGAIAHLEGICRARAAAAQRHAAQDPARGGQAGESEECGQALGEVGGREERPQVEQRRERGERDEGAPVEGRAGGVLGAEARDQSGLFCGFVSQWGVQRVKEGSLLAFFVDAFDGAAVRVRV